MHHKAGRKSPCAGTRASLCLSVRLIWMCSAWAVRQLPSTWPGPGLILMKALCLCEPALCVCVSLCFWGHLLLLSTWPRVPPWECGRPKTQHSVSTAETGRDKTHRPRFTLLLLLLHIGLNGLTSSTILTMKERKERKILARTTKRLENDTKVRRRFFFSSNIYFDRPWEERWNEFYKNQKEKVGANIQLLLFQL